MTTRWNDRSHPLSFHVRDEVVAVVAAIADDLRALISSHERSRLRDVVRLTAGETVSNERALLGDDDMKLRRETSPRSAKCLGALASTPSRCSSCVRVSFDDGAVDQEQRRTVPYRQRLPKLLPMAGECPSPVATIDTAPSTEALLEITPWCSAPQDPNDGFEEATRLSFWTTAHQSRDPRRDGPPSLIGEEVPLFPHRQSGSAY